MKQPMKLNPVEYATVEWYWTVPIGQTCDDLLKPSYWQHVTAQLRPGHEVKAVAEDGSFWAHLFVRSVGKVEATMGVITKAEFDADLEEPQDMDTYVRWRGPAKKYGVFRKEDDECLRDGFDTKPAAYEWAAQRVPA